MRELLEKPNTHLSHAAAAWINQQSELMICVRTMLVGPAVVIREGHHVIGTGETLEEAVNAAMKKQQNDPSSPATPDGVRGAQKGQTK